ncbi:MAG TPA: Vms1/Ankzf1 family peptidyl-tRNA hydrolase [Pyrinomonadaceae bacterium]|nr:Vms1/Ankzf1 family peptidyl-tRNA hydrolase [Pyrinomonadaceae bacterium]
MSASEKSFSLNKLMDKLAAFEHTDLPFLSLYLNAQANQHGQQDYERFLRKEFRERAKTYEAHTPARESFDRDVERINAYLADKARPQSNAIAIFACAGANDFFEAVQLEAPLDKHRLYIYNQPHLYPLARLIDQFPRYAVLVCDSNRARIFVFGRGTTLEAEEIQNVKINRHKAGGWSQMRFQRHADNYHLLHAKEVADALGRIVDEERAEHVILAGDEVIIPVLREQLPKALTEKVIDIVSLDINTPEHEIFDTTLESLREHDAETDAEKVKRLFDEYRAGGLGVVGARATLEALAMGQVDELFLTASIQEIKAADEDIEALELEVVITDDPVVAGSDPASDQMETPSVVMADELVTRAQQTAATVTFVEDPALLAEVGGVGALLRYRI